MPQHPWTGPRTGTDRTGAAATRPIIALCLTLSLIAGGCARPDRRDDAGGAEADRPGAETAADPQRPAGGPGTATNVQLLDATLTDLSAAVGALPARTEAQDRQRFADAFDALAEALVLLRRDDGDGAFRQRVETLRTSADRLRTAPTDVRTERRIDAALRSAASALDMLQQARFADSADLAEPIERLRERVGELDDLSGPLHRLIAAQSLEQTADVLRRMTERVRQQAERQFAAPRPADDANGAPGAGEGAGADAGDRSG